MEAAFLLVLFAGLLTLIAGMLWTRVNWRPDVEPFSRQTRAWDVTIHPERYAKCECVRAIRTINAAGALLLGTAVLIAGYKILTIQFG